MGQAFNLSLSKPDCANGQYGVNFFWEGSGDYWVNISDDPQFSGWAEKYVGGANSTNCPSGFSENARLDPGITYYWRVYDVQTGLHTYASSWQVPICAQANVIAPSNLQSSLYQVGSRWDINLSWLAASPTNEIQGQFVDVGLDPGFPDGSYTGYGTSTGADRLTLTSVQPDILWYWRVTALDVYGQWHVSQTASFKVTTSPPAAQGNPASALNSAYLQIGSSYRVQLSWNRATADVPILNQFLDFGNDGSFPDGSYQSFSLDVLVGVRIIDNVLPGTYWWRITNQMQGGGWLVSSGVSVVLPVISGGGGDPTCVPAGNLVINHYNKDSGVMTLSWGISVNATQVYLDVSDKPGWIDGQYQSLNIMGNYGAFFTLGGFLLGVRYYFRLTTQCGESWITTSDISFVTGTISPPQPGSGGLLPPPHPTPVLPVPISASEGVYNPAARSATVHFEWAIGGGVGISRQQYIDISTDPGFPAGNVYATSFLPTESRGDVGGILPGVLQYWRVAMLWQWTDGTEAWFHSQVAEFTPVSAPPIAVDAPPTITAAMTLRQMVELAYSAWGNALFVKDTRFHVAAVMAAITWPESRFIPSVGGGGITEPWACMSWHTGDRRSYWGLWQIGLYWHHGQIAGYSGIPDDVAHACAMANWLSVPYNNLLVARLIAGSDGGSITHNNWEAYIDGSPTSLAYLADAEAILASMAGSVQQTSGTGTNQPVTDPIYSPRQSTPIPGQPGATRVQ